MRKYAVPFMTALFSSWTTLVMAHGDADDLGHHWHMANYISEVRLQTLVILVFIICVVVIVAAKRAVARRKNRI